MKKIIVSLGIIFWLNAASFLQAQTADLLPPVPGSWWIFKAKTEGAISSSSDALNGTYLVSVNNSGNLERFEINNSELIQLQGTASEELLRMIGFYAAGDTKQYVKFPLDLNSKWTAEWKHQTWRRTAIRRAEYKVEKMENVVTDGKECATYKIRGDNHIGPQSWDSNYCPLSGGLVKWHYDSAVNGTGAKITIELVKYGSGSPPYQNLSSIK